MAKPKMGKRSRLANLKRRIWAPAEYGLLEKKEAYFKGQAFDIKYKAEQISKGYSNYVEGKRMTREARKLFAGDLPHPETIKIVIDNELANMKIQLNQVERELSAIRVQKKIIEKARQKESR